MFRRALVVVASAALLMGKLAAQDIPAPAKPGPEHKLLQAFEGTWDCKMTMAGAPAPITAVSTYKSELGGLWLASEFKCDDPAFKFTGRGLDGYDINKKKFVGIWVDSMSTGMMTMEGTHDEKTKTTTMFGQGYDQGKLNKYKNVTKVTDNDHHTFQMFMVGDDGKETLAFTIEYTRRK